MGGSCLLLTHAIHCSCCAGLRCDLVLRRAVWNQKRVQSDIRGSSAATEQSTRLGARFEGHLRWAIASTHPKRATQRHDRVCSRCVQIRRVAAYAPTRAVHRWGSVYHAVTQCGSVYNAHQSDCIGSPVYIGTDLANDAGNAETCTSLPLPPDVSQELTSETLRCNPDHLARLMADHTQLDWRPQLPPISVPCLNMIGCQSGCFPVAGCETVNKLTPGEILAQLRAHSRSGCNAEC